MSLSKNPALNLKAVLQETGIAADTLRAWERRYGLPLPQRTAGGHRLYSHYDVETIKWLIARQAEGLSISRAVDLWNEQLGSGIDPLAGVSASTLTSTISPPATLAANSNLDSLRTQWIAACLVFNEASAEQILNQAFSIFPVESVCIEVLQKGMVEIGTLWYHNNASIQQEHFASNLSMRRLDALMSASPAPSRLQTVLVGCPPGEWHTFTPLLLSLFLRRRGLNVIYLGANVPTEQFAETINTVKADLIILIAQTLISAAALQNAANSLSSQKVPVSFGGRIFNQQHELIDYMPAHYLGDTIETSLEQVEKLLKSRGKIQPAKIPSQAYRNALQAFHAQRLQIENELKELTPPAPDMMEAVDSGTQMLGDNIIAALQFGDMEHVSGELEWLETMLEARQRPLQELIHLIKNYTRAVRKYLKTEGTPIKEWLAAQEKNLASKLEAGAE